MVVVVAVVVTIVALVAVPALVSTVWWHAVVARRHRPQRVRHTRRLDVRPRPMAPYCTSGAPGTTIRRGGASNVIAGGAGMPTLMPTCTPACAAEPGGDESRERGPCEMATNGHALLLSRRGTVQERRQDIHVCRSGVSPLPRESSAMPPRSVSIERHFTWKPSGGSAATASPRARGTPGRLLKKVEMLGARKRTRRRSASYAAQVSDRATTQIGLFQQPCRACRACGVRPPRLVPGARSAV